MAGVKGRSGGVRPGAGRKPAKPRKRKAKALQTHDPDAFLRAVMADPNADFKDRMAAALALKKAGKGLAPMGKREQQQAAAQAVVERNLAPAAAPTRARPKLVSVK
jgi:phage terminase small subunit